MRIEPPVPVIVPDIQYDVNAGEVPPQEPHATKRWGFS
jgi:hypothetical protein